MPLTIEDVDMPVGSRARGPSRVRPLCRPCFRLDERVHADGFCVDCDEVMCKTCWTDHRKLKSLHNHVLRDLDTHVHTTSGDVSSGDGPLNVPAFVCADHGGAALEYYCTYCSVACCRACVGADHASCFPVHLPPVPVPRGVTPATDHTQLNTHLQVASNRTALIIDKLKDHKAQGERKANEILELKHVYDDFQGYIGACLGDLSATVDQLQLKHKQHCRVVINKTNQVLASLDSLRSADGKQGREQKDRAKAAIADVRRLLASQPDRSAPEHVAAALGEMEDLLAATRLGEGDPGPPVPDWLEPGTWGSPGDARPCHVSGALVSARGCVLADSGNGKVKVGEVVKVGGEQQHRLLAEMPLPHLFC